MQVDIRVPQISLRRRVWRLFPGEGYSFLGTFQSDSVGFLDLPGASLPADRPTAPNAILNQIKKSIALREAIYEHGRDITVEVEKIDISKYRSSEKRTREENAIINFYYEASPGDLVVLPEPVRMSRIWIGVFRGSNITSAAATKRYGKYPIPSRDIIWGRSVSESAVSAALSSSLRQAHPFTLLEKSLFYEVFALAYGSYIYGDRRAATVFNGNEFLDSDSSLIANVTKIAAAACQIVAESGDLASADRAKLLSILLSNPPAEYACTQESDIHSRGFTRLSSGADVPLVAVAILASLMLLSSCATKEDVKTKVAEIKYVNSSPSGNAACNARVSQAAKIGLDFMDADTTWKLCEAAREADRRKIKPSARPISKE
ncbi:hypothetical protein [Methylobacterium fujisawaense]|uniref:hypothetical protein n=1 Tax=Methylobacterium fujisawaense TaxID=107400 RepID=UPI002F353F2F